MTVNEISGDVVDAAMHVHSVLGPGLLEGVYEACLAFELRKRGHTVHVQRTMPVTYEDVRINFGVVHLRDGIRRVIGRRAHRDHQ